MNPFEGDRLNRKPDAELLTQLITVTPRPAVISVDAPWGGGKTTFIRMWRDLLVERGFQVASYNAWETDFVDDPLIAFIGELESDIALLKDGASGTPAIAEQWRRLKTLGAGVIRATGPLAIRIATQGLLDAKSVRDVLGFVSGSDQNIASYLERITEERLAAYATEKEAVASFRSTLSVLAKELSERGEAQGPLIIFVDELDRCRPVFALALLERMKHLFSVDGVLLVLALDRTQLAHTVRAVYGTKFAAEGYLRRFIDFDYHLPRPQGKEFVLHLAEQHHVKEVYQQSTASADEAPLLVDTFHDLSLLFELSLRDQEQAFARIVLALRSAESPQHYLYTPLVVFFGVIRTAKPNQYQAYVSGGPVEALLTLAREQPGGVKFLNSHRGRLCQAYVLLSAPKDAGASDLLRAALSAVDDETAPDHEREAARHLHRLIGHVQHRGASSAFQAALSRMERINRQVEIGYID